MKRSFLFVVVLVMVCAAASAQIDLSGEASTGLSMFPVFPYTSDRFESPVNLDNISGIHDVALDTDVTFRLEAGREAGTFTLWLAVNPYQMSRLLLSSASTDPLAETLLLSDPAALSVLRANVAWYIGQSFVLRLGRQSMFTGYGYGWNPMDFANTAKDPFDPEAELRGVDALSLQFYLGNIFSLKLAGIFRTGDSIARADYEDLQVDAELTASLPQLELKLSGYYDHDDSRGEDAFVPALGAGFMLDLAGVGIYGEGALLWGGRTPVPLPVAFTSPVRKDELLASGLLGVQYTFTSELRLIAEYFYNGEGYSLHERRLFNDRLLDDPLDPAIYAEHAANYRPGYFARHYLLLNLGYPIYPWNANAELSAYYSPDSTALGIVPSVELEISGSLSVRCSYTGMFSLQEDRYDEAWLSPMKHILELQLTCFF
jgi:hypothetical protein